MLFQSRAYFNRFAFSRSSVLASLAIASLSLTVSLAGCNQCLLRYRLNNQPVKCALDTCPKNSEWSDAQKSCQCKANFVNSGGACVTQAEASSSCGAGYQFVNGSCVSTTCAVGQVLNAQTNACEDKAAKDQAVAQNAGISLGQGKQIGCKPGETYVVNGNDGACVPNESTCGAGTKWDGQKCAAATTQCNPGEVFDTAKNACVKLTSENDKEKFSVQTKLAAALSPEFCAPHARNPGSFGIAPGQSMDVKITVAVSVPGNEIDKVQASSIRVTNGDGPELPTSSSGVQSVNHHVNDQVIGGIKALGGKSVETEASASVTCTIRRSPIQIIDVTSGGV